MMLTCNNSKEEQLTLIIIKIERVKDFLNRYLPLICAQNTDIIVKDLWTKYVPETLDCELLSLDIDSLSRLPKLNILSQDLQCSQIISLLEEAQKLSVDGLSIESDLSNLLSGPAKTVSLHSNYHGMPQKKVHEVPVMADVCAKIAHRKNISQVIDIGSGKGYLGSELALCHGLNVLGIDSSQSNTEGAELRDEELRNRFQKDRHKGKLEASSLRESIAENQDSSVNENTGIYCPITMLVDIKTDLDKIMDENFPNENSGVLVTGLHTCGNLAANILRIFASNDNCLALCNVGCCYNLINEEFSESQGIGTCDILLNKSGFPMSSHLQQQKFCLGRNARMIAAQAVDRMAGKQEKGPRKSLFWRAVLQKILQEKTGELKDDWKIGRLAKKCNDFKEYVIKAFQKLGYSHLISQLSTEVLDGYLKFYKEYEIKTFAFFQLRAVFAPVIECFIILDRMCYLWEQESVKDVHLVKMFDPVTSPRCYSILAFK
ncbi:putative methyltransferase-like protein 25 [Tubulanus polymorphus]|uniref:putative methyltransferase-like protein 25 n=1 Tax=Tubulanus polymorphus TaxID=672921 RepID=UPI003DA24D86